MVMANAEVYHRQFGWNTDYEVLVAGIVAGFGARHDPARETGWIAELDGRRVGCVFLVATDDPTVARLRILVVTPDGRGRQLGTRLVQECLTFARNAGYQRVTLWTNDVLVAARRIYESFGFTLTDQEPHHSFGHDLVGQNWMVEL
ncbi:GNAT family N-acetyltransferase [Actinoplanes couchii]